jgi:hypothetical protein
MRCRSCFLPLMQREIPRTKAKVIRMYSNPLAQPATRLIVRDGLRPGGVFFAAHAL